MGLDALLAIGHHVVAFGVLATLAAEWALVRPGLGGREVGRLGRIDAAYGAAAGAVLAIGLGCLFMGALDTNSYLSNPFFRAKMSAFGAIALLSIRPSVNYQRWRRAAASDAAWAAPLGELAATRRTLVLELARSSARHEARGTMRPADAKDQGGAWSEAMARIRTRRPAAWASTARPSTAAPPLGR